MILRMPSKICVHLFYCVICIPLVCSVIIDASCTWPQCSHSLRYVSAAQMLPDAKIIHTNHLMVVPLNRRASVELQIDTYLIMHDLLAWVFTLKHKPYSFFSFLTSVSSLLCPSLPNIRALSPMQTSLFTTLSNTRTTIPARLTSTRAANLFFQIVEPANPICNRNTSVQLMPVVPVSLLSFQSLLIIAIVATIAIM